MPKIDYSELNAILISKGLNPVPIDKGEELEELGWEKWLMTLFPFWFTDEFSDDHRRFWELRWNTLLKFKNNEPVEESEQVCLLLLARGLGKSSVLEAARIMYGAILGTGYSLIISETDDQAQEHLGNCRILIDHPDSRLTEYYPGMAVAEASDVLKGMPTADRKEMFICKNGWICRGKGLTAKMRGLRIGAQRPTEVVLDDIDDVNDSLAVSLSKERQITASILPVLARKHTIIDFGQNLITSHSFANRVFTGKTDALAEKTVFGVTNAFEPLFIDSQVDEVGKLRHTITGDSVPTWKGLDVKRAQAFLNRSGLETFLAEYQNEFDQYRAGRVISNYNENIQIITWSEFEKVFGERRIPQHWKCMAGLDVGYSEGQYPHYSAWDFLATSAMNSPYPNLIFLYRSRTFKGTSIDDQAVQIKNDLWDNENIITWQMSHERTGEMMTLQQKYHLMFTKFRYYKAEDGVAQWKHLSMIDRSKPHPFRDDTEIDGQYELGRCQLYYIVDDDQKLIARDDNGLKIFREQVANWDYVPVKLTDTGQTIQRPSKVNDDHCFIAGTQIATDQGNKAIEDIQVGDKVLTRYGYYPVTDIFPSRISDVIQVQWDGGALIGTPDHPIITQNGVVDLGCLNDSVTLFAWKENQNVLNFVPANVQINAIGKQRVFNFTVQNHHEYFANGILVHNCDVTKSCLQYFAMSATPLSREEKILQKIPEQLQNVTELNDFDKVQRNLMMQKLLQNNVPKKNFQQGVNRWMSRK